MRRAVIPSCPGINFPQATLGAALARARPAADRTQERLLSALPKPQREEFLGTLARVVTVLSDLAETA